MRLVWKGKLSDSNSLPSATLPKDAVAFKQLGKMIYLWLIPILAIITLVVYLRISINGLFLVRWTLIAGTIIATGLIIVHEILHAVCYPQNAVIEFSYSPQSMVMCIASTHPITKKRFIWIALFPAFIIGIIPLVGFIFIPAQYVIASNLILISAGSSLCCAIGDFQQVLNTLRRVPQGAMIQFSHDRFYWYLPTN